MDYIISPAVFYWMHVADALRTTLVLLMSCSIIGSFILLGAWIGDWAYDDETTMMCRKWCIRTAIISVFFILAVILLPNKETMLEMLIARLATKSNVGITVSGIKSVVDYIIEAADAIR